MKIKKGFTLVELLVVISIVGLLASLALVSYGGAQRQSRDSQRRSDLAQYRNGIENHAHAHGAFYVSLTGTPHGLVDDVCIVELNPAGGSDFVSGCPEDPLLDPATGTPQYWYEAPNGSGGGVVDAIDYVMWADLEIGDWWVVCSDGRSGESGAAPAGGTCPL